MKRTLCWGKNIGFALPTVMIASVVMLMVLLSGLVASSSVNVSLRSQYNNRILKHASEAGMAMVDACMTKSYGVASWTDPAKPLKPNTDCQGNVVVGLSPYVLQGKKDPSGPITYRTSFTVPPISYEYGAQRANVSATLENLRTSSNTVVNSTNTTGQQLTETRSVLVGAQTGFSNVTFGYCSSGCGADQGAQLAVVLGNGEVKTLGRNNNGRLGSATVADSSIPSTFILPVNERGIAAFSNFLSIGRQLSVITSTGKVFSAGSNNFGQLGSGTVTGAESTPRQFSLPAGVSAKFVGMSNYATYVMGDNNRIYAAGSCTNGVLGTGAGCADTSTPTLVALPAPTADTNTQPETTTNYAQSTNMAVDRLNAYVRMKGGFVYGWGANDYGQLADGTTTAISTPKRIQATSSFSTPSAQQIAFNGTTLYVLDTNGRVWAGGDTTYGQAAGVGTIVRNLWNNGTRQSCMKALPSDPSYIQAYDGTVTNCNKGDGWQYMEWWPDGTWRFRSNSYSVNPTDAMTCATVELGSSAPGVPDAYNDLVRLRPCNGSAAQQWEYRTDKTIYNASTNRCATWFDYVYHSACLAPAGTGSNYEYQLWNIETVPYLRPVPVPMGSPLATKITTDNGGISILYANGQVWAAGSNTRGQLGIGASYVSAYNPALRRVILPAGLTVTDIYTAEIDPVAPSTGVNNGSYNNTFYVMSDGSVYGAGANNFGQLGIGSVSEYSATPVKMLLPAGVLAKSVQTGYGTTIVISTTGKVFTVGNNSNGQLGDGTTTSSSTPKANPYTNQRTSIIY